jgi:predicted aspartyl protease
LTTEADGEVSVPVTVDGHGGLMLVDTGGMQTILGETVATQLQLPISSGVNRFVLFGGIRLGQVATPHVFELGGMTAHDMPMIVAPFTALHNDDIGVLAPDVLSNYDVEIDFAGGKFNLFNPSECSAAPIYWTREPVAAVPFEFDRDGHIMISIQLDGIQMKAGVDTGADRSTMILNRFEDLFRKKSDDPGLVPFQDAVINGRRTKIYRYTFQTMTFEGIQVQRPNIDMVSSDGLGGEGPDIILGIETLRQLHMYIAYKDKMVYFTAAEAR